MKCSNMKHLFQPAQELIQQQYCFLNDCPIKGSDKCLKFPILSSACILQGVANFRSMQHPEEHFPSWLDPLLSVDSPVHAAPVHRLPGDLWTNNRLENKKNSAKIWKDWNNSNVPLIRPGEASRCKTPKVKSCEIIPLRSYRKNLSYELRY